MAAVRRPARTVLAAVAGGVCGYLACTVAANLEDFQFYTARRWATGESAMSRIVQHPADRWVTPAIVILFVSAGVLVGTAAEHRLRIAPAVEK